MMDPASPPACAETKFQTNLADALPRKIKRSNSFTTATTSATEESSCCEDSQNGGSHKPKKVTSPMTPGRQTTKYMMTMTKNAKNPNMKALPSVALDEPPKTQKAADLNDSFESNEDNEWWNQESPQSTPVANPNSKTVPKPQALSDIIPEERRAKTEGSISTSGSGEKKKKKKVKRISVTKVKAGDLNSTSTPKFRSKSGKPLTEEEMQEALKMWKTEQMKLHPSTTGTSEVKDRRPKSVSRRRSSDGDDLHGMSSSANRSKSASRSRASNDVVARSSIPGDIRRPKSASRRRSVDHCSISMVPVGISGGDPRRAKSASRRRPQGSEGSRSSHGDERAESDRRRSRSVGRKVREDEPSRRSRSVVRKGDGESREDQHSHARPRSKSLSHKKGPESAAEKDRRSQSRARPREGDNTKRSKSTSRSYSGSKTERRVESERPGRSSVGSPELRRRSKSLGRTRSFDDDDDDDRRKLKRATNIKDRRSNSRHRARGLSFSKEKDEFQKLANQSCGENFFSAFTSEELATDDGPKKAEFPASKNIPWSDFLLHSATSSRSLGTRDK